MAVTPTHELPGRRLEPDPDSEPQGEEHRTDEEEQSDSQPAPGRSRKMQIIGGVAVFVILALYFVWIGEEMGGHALSGTTEMVAIFGAILLGIVALVAGGAISRKTADGEGDRSRGEAS